MESFLITFGFTEAEVTVYSILVKQGGCSVSELAHLTELRRSSCQEYLRSLVKKGFVNLARVGKKYLYQAEDPDKFRQVISERHFLADRLVAALETLQKPRQVWEARIVSLAYVRREMKILDKKRVKKLLFGSSQAGGAVYDRRVILVSSNNDIPAIDISSEEIADLHRKILKKS